jgi:hypothetical protein
LRPCNRAYDQGASKRVQRVNRRQFSANKIAPLYKIA